MYQFPIKQTLKLILIGSSTGGPGHIDKILKGLKQNFEGTIIIAQHMSPHFIESFARQIGTISPLEVHVVRDGMVLHPSSVYICSGECRIVENHAQLVFNHQESHESVYTPDIDILFSSAAMLPSSFKRLGVILTGIGEDGARGALALFHSGGKCIFESEESAIVYGMPRRALELVPQADTGTIYEIVTAIERFGEE